MHTNKLLSGQDFVGGLVVVAVAGIYYSPEYDGSTTANLVNIPGEITAVDHSGRPR